MLMSIISVNCENLQSNPRCAHGPTLKFSRLVKGKIKTFYACSACRDRKECPFFLWEDETLTSSKQLALEDWKNKTFPSIQRDIVYKRLEDFRKISGKKQFCLSCFDYVFPQETNHKGHLLRTINNEDLSYPTKILYPVTNDKNQAQYWFSEKSVKFIIDSLVNIKCMNVLCIGTPSLHEVLKSKNIKSLLLDIDHRYHWFYRRDEFLWFNMFNFYFLKDHNDCISELRKFLNNSSVVVIIDPPFGARIEPLYNTILELKVFEVKNIQIILVLPYFMEPQVLKSFPDLTLLDFPIEYLNHKKFKDKSNDKKGSPVRIFTSIKPKNFVFPLNEGYHYCDKCEAWRSKLNIHCDLCKCCPSKNGDSYRHCKTCGKCVKQTWRHCSSCDVCHLPGQMCISSKKVEVHSKKKKKR